MRIRKGILLAAAAAAVLGPLVGAAGAQGGPGRGEARALLGLTVSLSGTDRDTLGVLVSAVVPDGPAELAGIAQGSRLSVVNGTSLRIDAEDVGRPESAEAVLRRLARALQSVEPGSEVALRVFADNRFRLVRLQAAEPRRPDAAGEELAWAALGDVPAAAPRPATTTRAAARPVAAGTAPSAATVASIVEALAALQTQVHRLTQDQESGALLDTLLAVDHELGLLRRRLRAATAQPAEPQPAAAPAVAPAAAARGSGDASDGGASLPGLRVSAVGSELVAYFGEGSERGLLVLQADSSWSPIRAGDVLLSVNGASVTVQRLRALSTTPRPGSVELLRRKRPLTVTLAPRR